MRRDICCLRRDFWGALLEAETNSSPQSAPEAAAWRGTRGRRRRKKSRSGPRRSSNRAGHTALTSIVSHSRFPTSTGMAGPPLPLPHLFSRALTSACRGYTPLGTRGQSDPPSRASNPSRACGPAIEQIVGATVPILVTMNSQTFSPFSVTHRIQYLGALMFAVYRKFGFSF